MIKSFDFNHYKSLGHGVLNLTVHIYNADKDEAYATATELVKDINDKLTTPTKES